MEVLLEVYFGKVIALQQLEDTIDQIRLKYGSNWTQDISRIHKELNRDVLVKNMAKYIKNQFGFGEVIITISKSTKLNAHTFGVMADKNGIAYIDNDKVDLKETLIKSSEGIRFDTRKVAPSMLIVISMGMMFSYLISTPELVAALLHEIGHSFSKAMIGSDKFSGRMDEKFADQFATMYGYGTELTTVLNKISVFKQYDSGLTQALRTIPIVGVFVGLSNIFGSFIDRGIKDEVHPTIYRRSMDSIKQMEYDLSRSENLTRKQRLELENNIRRAKSYVSTFYDKPPYQADSVYRYWMKNIEPRLYNEVKQDNYANLYGSVDIVNKRIESLKNVR